MLTLLKRCPLTIPQEEARQGGKKGRLLGIITLSDVLNYIIGTGNEPDDELKSLASSSPTLPRHQPRP